MMSWRQARNPYPGTKADAMQPRLAVMLVALAFLIQAAGRREG
jgi:hypothetical protein